MIMMAHLIVQNNMCIEKNLFRDENSDFEWSNIYTGHSRYTGQMGLRFDCPVYRECAVVQPCCCHYTYSKYVSRFFCIFRDQDHNCKLQHGK